MTSARTLRQSRSSKANNEHVDGAQAEVSVVRTSIAAGRAGDWRPADELRLAALEAARSAGEVTLNLDNLDYLDASALQILLALDREQKNRGQQLSLAHVSPSLMQWFDFSGSAHLLAASQDDSYGRH
jgi:anti-anti-sigma factor